MIYIANNKYITYSNDVTFSINIFLSVINTNIDMLYLKIINKILLKTENNHPFLISLICTYNV